MLNILLYTFYFFCLFPYLQLISLNTDAQPYALILGLCLFPYLVSRNINKDILCILTVLIFSVLLLPFSKLEFWIFRSVINYISLFIISSVTYYGLKYQKGLSYTLFKLTVYIWFLVGLVQVTINQNFLSFLRYRGDNELMQSMGRGVVGLAVEPTFYGIVCLFFIFINYLNFRNRNTYTLLTILLIIQILLFAKSATCIFGIIISIIVYIFIKLIISKSKTIHLSFFFIFVLILYLSYININILKDYRYGELFLAFLQDPTKFIFVDGSVNERFIQFFFPINGFFSSYGLPHGFGNFAYYLDEVSKKSFYDNLIIYYSHETHKRIDSCVGSMLFELGILSFPFFYMLSKKIAALIKNNINTCYFMILFIFIIFNNINFNMSLLSFFIGNLIYLSNNITQNDKS